MRRRVEIAIDRLTVDPSLAGDRAALASAIERALAQRLQSPEAVQRLAAHGRTVADAGTVPRREGAGAIGSAVAAAALPGGGRS